MAEFSNVKEVPIPPILLKNFNVYEELKPQKNGASTSGGTAIDKLVDLDDSSQDSGFHEPSAMTSLFGKTRDFNLVDLYENLLVTPQHIKRKENSDVELNAPKFDVGYNRFFDMLESGEKIDWANVHESEDEVSKDDYIDRKPKVLRPKVFMKPDPDSEELIHELLMQKKLEKIALSRMDAAKLNLEKPKNLEPSRINTATNILQSTININVNKSSKIETGNNEFQLRYNTKPNPVESQINNPLSNFIVKAIQKDEKVYRKKRLVKPDNLKINYTKGPDFYEKSIVLPQIMARVNARLAYLDEKNNVKKRLILDAGEKLNNQHQNPFDHAESSTKTDTPQQKSNNQNSGIHSIKTVKKEQQSYINAITKNIPFDTTNKPCPNCTKPVANKTNCQSSSSVKADSEFGKLSPTVLMADCNKERLRAWEQSRRFKDFVLNGKPI